MQGKATSEVARLDCKRDGEQPQTACGERVVVSVSSNNLNWQGHMYDGMAASQTCKARPRARWRDWTASVAAKPTTNEDKRL